jgi:hypothetical protein
MAGGECSLTFQLRKLQVEGCKLKVEGSEPGGGAFKQERTAASAKALPPSPRLRRGKARSEWIGLNRIPWVFDQSFDKVSDEVSDKDPILPTRPRGKIVEDRGKSHQPAQVEGCKLKVARSMVDSR